MGNGNVGGVTCHRGSAVCHLLGNWAFTFSKAIWGDGKLPFIYLLKISTLDKPNVYFLSMVHFCEN